MAPNEGGIMKWRYIFMDFLRKWWWGPLGIGDIRELFFSIGDPRDNNARKDRGVHSFQGVELKLKNLFKHYRDTNMFYGVGLLISFQELEPKNMLYDRIVYDFDDEENPELAIRKAIEFAQSIERRFDCGTIVTYSGFKGAHVVIPLKKLINWESYQLIWKALLVPYSFKKLVDRNMLQWNRMDRIPYTWNVKRDKETGELRRGFCRIIYPKKLRAEEFDWSLFESLDPSDIEILKVELPELIIRPVRRRYIGSGSGKPKEKLPTNIEDLTTCNAVPPCIKNLIDTVVKVGDLDHYQRVVLVLYLKWVGFSVDNVVGFFRRYAKDFNERIARYQVEYLFGLRGSRRDYLMYSCDKMKQLGMCLGCGWDRNPVTYTYTKAKVPEELINKFFELVKKSSQLFY